ncbi:MAG: MFS transporter [Candidatus Thorarchaeota archaeon]
MRLLSYSRINAREFTGLSTFEVLAFFRRAIVYTFLSIYLRSLGLSTTEVTLMASVGMLANAGTQSLVWGRLLDRYRMPTEFVVIGEILAGIGHIFMVSGHMYFLGLNWLIPAGYVIIFSLGGIEVFWSMSNVGWSALISELTEADERKRIMGQFSIIGGFGGLGGAYLGGLLYEGGSGFASGTIFYIAAAIMVVSALIVYFTVRVRRVDELDRPGTDRQPGSHRLSDLPSGLRTSYLIFIAALILINFGRNSIATITSLFLSDPTGFNASGEGIALYSNVGSIASMIAGLVIGSVGARVSDNRVMVLGTMMAVAAISWLIFTPSFMLALISSFLVGSSQVIIQASSYSIVARMAPEEYRGRLFAYYNATFFLSWGIAATLLTGPIADILISQGFTNADAYRGSFVAAIAMVMVGIAVLLWFFRYVRSASPR